MKWKKLIILFFVLSIKHSNIYAQSNFISITQNSSWYFDCSDPSCLENGITIPNALTVTLKCTNSQGSVYAKQNANTWPSGWSPGAAPGGGSLQLDLTSKTSTNATNIQYNAVTISGSDTRLFVQPKMGSKSAAVSFTYDLMLKPTGYSYFIPGNYTFTMTFTMTEP